MELGLSEKVIVVTGSSRGVGQGIAGLLLEEGACIAITGRTATEVDATTETFAERFPGRVVGHTGDLLDPAVRQGLETRVLDTWSRVDGLVANAGALKPSDDFSTDDFDWFIRHNFLVAVGVINQFITQLERRDGAIVIIGSIAGVESIGAPLPYTASKAALSAYGKGLSDKMARKGVRVNTIAPGNIRFAGGNWDHKTLANPGGINDMLDAKVPLNRFGTPLEIAALTAFLLSGQSSFITGQTICADGGQTRR